MEGPTLPAAPRFSFDHRYTLSYTQGCGIMSKGKDWDQLLPCVMLGYNRFEGNRLQSKLHTAWSRAYDCASHQAQICQAEVLFEDEEVAAASILARWDAMRQRIAIAGTTCLLLSTEITYNYNNSLTIATLAHS